MRDEEKRKKKGKGKLEEEGKVKRRVGLGQSWQQQKMIFTRMDSVCSVYTYTFTTRYLMEEHYSKHQLGTGKVGRSVGSTVYPRFFNLYQAGR